MNVYDFGKRLKDLRIKKEISQSDLADFIGVSRSSIAFYEKNERQPDIVTLYKIANYFNVTSDYLLGIEASPSRDFDNINIQSLIGLNEKTVDKLKLYMQIVKGQTDISNFFNYLDFHQLENIQNASEVTTEFFCVINYVFNDLNMYTDLSDFFEIACVSLNKKAEYEFLQNKKKELVMYKDTITTNLDTEINLSEYNKIRFSKFTEPYTIMHLFHMGFSTTNYFNEINLKIEKVNKEINLEIIEIDKIVKDFLIKNKSNYIQGDNNVND